MNLTALLMGIRFGIDYTYYREGFKWSPRNCGVAKRYWIKSTTVAYRRCILKECFPLNISQEQMGTVKDTSQDESDSEDIKQIEETTKLERGDLFK